MENKPEKEIDGVTFVQQRLQESQHNTPVAKKTRAAIRLKSVEDDQPPKTPIASTSTRLLSETPRRSARKSTRPPMDYEDIVDRNLMRSACKDVKNASIAAVIEVEEEDATALKWTAAEVGRVSRKRSRSRKSKRAASKKAKMEEDKEQEQETEPPSNSNSGVQCCEENPISARKVSKKSKMQEDEEQEQKQEIEQSSNTKSEVECCEEKHISAKKAAVLEAASKDEDTASVSSKIMVQVEKKTHLNDFIEDKQDTDIYDELKETVEAANQSVDAAKAKTPDEIKEQETDPQLNSNAEEANPSYHLVRVTDEDLDELGLCQIKDDTKTEDEDIEEMPSLVLLDDDEPAEVLNRTFDMEESTEKIPSVKSNDKSKQLDFDMPKLQVSPEVAIKVVLTDENDEDTSLLTLESNKPYRFPTPFKSNYKLNLKFNETKKTNLNAPCRTNRRSKSACDTIEEKTKCVSFFSPIEVTAVNDIDKRWEALNVSHVTKRRKRSKSLDNPITKSKIPRPKFFGATKAPSPVQTKAKPRTKLPNFAAIHQKQFSKMENLVDHIERKAVRAKELTSSAKKLLPGGTASAQKSSAKKVAPYNIWDADRARPKVQKKILAVSDLLSPVQPEVAERQRNLPTPRKIIAVQPQPMSRMPIPGKPPTKAFSSTATAAPSVKIFSSSATVAPSVKIFSSTATAAPGSNLSAKPCGTFENKMEARRKRHMEMFKERTSKENRRALIRGVRSNRRFDLQMEHRRQMNEKS